MPGATLPNISIVLPTLGCDTGVWDDEINAALTLIDAHDHTAGKGLRIKSAAISIDANLSFGGFAITAAGQLAFTAVTALAAGSKILFVNTSDNELYWRTNAGTNVKLTSGASINTSLVGGIVGDYASVGAEVAYDDASDTYTFKQQNTKPWAKIACGGLKLLEYNTTTTNAISLLCPAALGAAYILTLPGALPGSTQLVQVTSAGVMTFTNTVVNAITAPDYKRSSSTGGVDLGAAHAIDGHGSHTRGFAASGATEHWVMEASTNALTWPIPINVGDRITGWTLVMQKLTSNANTVSAQMFKVDPSVPSETAIGAAATSAANAPGQVILSKSGLTETVVQNIGYHLVFFSTGGVAPAKDQVFTLYVSWDHP